MPSNHRPQRYMSCLTPEQIEFIASGCDAKLRTFVRWELPPDLRRQEVVDDLVQTVYRKIFQAQFEWRSPTESLAWLRKTAQNAIKDWHKQKHHAREYVVLHPADSSSRGADNLEPHTSDTPSRVVARKEAREAVQVALKTLPAKWQEAIRLKFVECLSYKEIAAEMETSEDAVRGYLQRAKEKLRDVLGRASLYLSSG